MNGPHDSMKLTEEQRRELLKESGLSDEEIEKQTELLKSIKSGILPPLTEETKMNATGIVRRIDDLGRVVIPKEIRNALDIREGDPLEIFTDSEGSVDFRKYLPRLEECRKAGGTE